MILRSLFPLLSLLAAGFSIVAGNYSHAPDSSLCRWGGCLFNQMYDEVKATGVSDARLKALLIEDPGNPDQWCTSAEYLRARGKTAEAKALYDRAIVLGTGLASVRMRAANFYFANGYSEDALRLAPLILSNTDQYDEALFSFVFVSGKPMQQLLGTTIPAGPRPARHWMGWLLNQEHSDNQVLATWDWMHNRRLLNADTAGQVVDTLWQRGHFAVAQNLWSQWDNSYQNPNGELLANASLQKPNEAAPDIPFAWDVSPVPSAEFVWKDGLDVHGLDVRFLGQANLDFRSVRQSRAVTPGRYRFAAELSAQDLTTDEGVALQITDTENPGRLSVQTKPMLGTITKSRVELEFITRSTTPAITVQVVRKPSLKFDSKISGTLHIYSMSLRRIGAS